MGGACLYAEEVPSGPLAMRRFSPLVLTLLRVIVALVAVVVSRHPVVRLSPVERDPARISAISSVQLVHAVVSSELSPAREAPPAPLKKIPVAVPFAWRQTGTAIASYASSLEMRSISAGVALRILKRIPRMESGDPPRV